MGEVLAATARERCRLTMLQARNGVDGQTGRSNERPQARRFTECWKSCNQEFALSIDALSVDVLNTSSADKTACMSAIVDMRTIVATKKDEDLTKPQVCCC